MLERNQMPHLSVLMNGVQDKGKRERIRIAINEAVATVLDVAPNDVSVSVENLDDRRDEEKTTQKYDVNAGVATVLDESLPGWRRGMALYELQTALCLLVKPECENPPGEGYLLTIDGDTFASTNAAAFVRFLEYVSKETSSAPVNQTCQIAGLLEHFIKQSGWRVLRKVTPFIDVPRALAAGNDLGISLGAVYDCSLKEEQGITNAINIVSEMRQDSRRPVRMRKRKSARSKRITQPLVGRSRLWENHLVFQQAAAFICLKADYDWREYFRPPFLSHSDFAGHLVECALNKEKFLACVRRHNKIAPLLRAQGYSAREIQLKY